MTDRADSPKMSEILREWLRPTAQVTPTEPLPVLKRAASDFERTPPTGLRITWLGHATSIVEIDGRRFLIDPVWARRASPFSWIGPKRFFEPPLPLNEVPALDAILISHDHYDHLDRKTVVRLARTGTPFVVPTGKLDVAF